MAFSSGTIVAPNGTVPVLTDGQSSVVFNITGTWSATLALQATVDGTTWFTISGYNVATQAPISTFTANQAVLVSCSGYQQVQVIATAFTSGTVNVAWDSSNGGNNAILTSTVSSDRTGSVALTAGGSTAFIAVNGCSTFQINTQGIGSNIVYVEGSIDGINYPLLLGIDATGLPQQSVSENGPIIYACGGIQTIKLLFGFYSSGTTTIDWSASAAVNTAQVFNINQNGLKATVFGVYSALPLAGNLGNISISGLDCIRIENLLSTSPTYQIAINSATPGTAPTDIVTISGSATKVIRVTRIIFSSTQTTAGINNWFIVKRSALNTGGTSSTPTIVPSDSTNPAVTAVVKLYSANPTALGAVVGNVQVQKLLSPLPATTGSYNPAVFDFTNGGVGQGIVLRNANELLAINFNGAALPTGLAISAIVEWQEF